MKCAIFFHNILRMLLLFSFTRAGSKWICTSFSICLKNNVSIKQCVQNTIYLWVFYLHIRLDCREDMDNTYYMITGTRYHIILDDDNYFAKFRFCLFELCYWLKLKKRELERRSFRKKRQVFCLKNTQTTST